MQNDTTKQVTEEQINAHTTGEQMKNVPAEVWLDKFKCADYNACTKQNGSDFSYIPLTDLNTYNGPSIQ